MFQIILKSIGKYRSNAANGRRTDNVKTISSAYRRGIFINNTLREFSSYLSERLDKRKEEADHTYSTTDHTDLFNPIFICDVRTISYFSFIALKEFLDMYPRCRPTGALNP